MLVCQLVLTLTNVLVCRATSSKQSYITEAHAKKSMQRQLKQERVQTKHLLSKLNSFEARSASIRQFRQERNEAELRAEDLQRDLNEAQMTVEKAAARCGCVCM